MRQDAVCKSENPIRPLSDDQARQVFPHSWNFPSQPSGPGTRGSLQVWAGFSKVNITFKTSTFHTWDLLSVNWILTGWGLDYVNRFNAWRAFGLFSLKLKCVCALMSVMIVDVVQEKRYRSDFWVQLQLRQQLCNFQNNDTVSISLQCCGGWGGFCREAVAQTLRREWSRLTTSRSIQFHAPGAKLLLALAAALFRVSPLCDYYLQGKTINSQIQHPAVVGSEPQPMPIDQHAPAAVVQASAVTEVTRDWSVTARKQLRSQRGSCSLTCSDVVVDAFHWDGCICDSTAL